MVVNCAWECKRAQPFEGYLSFIAIWNTYNFWIHALGEKSLNLCVHACFAGYANHAKPWLLFTQAISRVVFAVGNLEGGGDVSLLTACCKRVGSSSLTFLSKNANDVGTADIRALCVTPEGLGGQEEPIQTWCSCCLLCHKSQSP